MYIKGGSVVDGNFYIEGGLRVNSIRDAQGNSYISMSAIEPGRLVKFSETDTGKLVNTGIKESVGTYNGSAYTLLTAITNYCTMVPLKKSTTGGDSTTKYYDANFNILTSSSGATYRTLTSSETNLMTSSSASTRVIPDAWAYVS